MKKYLIFLIPVLSGCSMTSLLDKNAPVPSYSPSADIHEYDNQLVYYFKNHPELCISETWPEELNGSAEFEEVDEWLAPVLIDSNTYILSLKPRGIEGQLFFKADSFYHMRQYETARQFYRKVIEVNPSNWFAYMNIGDTFFIGDEFDTAAYWFRKSIEVNGFNWKSWKYMADLYNSTGQKEKAIDASIRSIILNPYGFEAWSLLSFLGRKYNFEIWNPQDSVFMKKIINENESCILYRTNQMPQSRDLIELSAKSFLLADKIKEHSELYSQVNLAESNSNIEKDLSFWALSYEIYIRNWDSKKDKENNALYVEFPYNDYLETVFRTHNLRFHIFWTDILREKPTYSMYLSVEEFEQLVEFFRDYYILSNN